MKNELFWILVLGFTFSLLSYSFFFCWLSKFNRETHVAERFIALPRKSEYYFPHNFIFVIYRRKTRDLKWFILHDRSNCGLMKWRLETVESYVRFLEANVPHHKIGHNFAFLLNMDDGHREFFPAISDPKEVIVHFQQPGDHRDQWHLEPVGGDPRVHTKFLFPTLTYCKQRNDPTVHAAPDPHMVRDEGLDAFLPKLASYKGGLAFAGRGEKKMGIVWRGTMYGKTRLDLFQVESQNRWRSNLYLLPDNFAVDIEWDSYMSIEEMSEYEFQLDIDGWANAWDALRWKLASGSVVIKLKSQWSQWYYPRLIEGVHFIGIDSMDQLGAVLQDWSSDARAPERERMARRAQEFALREFHFQAACQEASRIMEVCASEYAESVHKGRLKFP